MTLAPTSSQGGIVVAQLAWGLTTHHRVTSAAERGGYDQKEVNFRTEDEKETLVAQGLESSLKPTHAEVWRRFRKKESA
jgi:hypothetical protein